MGKTNLKVSILGLGGGSLAQLRKQEATSLIERALDLGINFFDTHRYYGDSEEKIGLAIKNRRENCIICTKFKSLQKNIIIKDLENSLRALNTERIDIYLFKDLNKEKTLKEFLSSKAVISFIKKARQQGKIDYFGFSSKDIKLALKAISSFPFDVIEVPFNLIKDEAIKELIPLARQKGIGIIAIQPFAGGALSLPYKLKGCVRLMYYFFQNPILTFALLNKVSMLSKDIQMKLGFSQLITYASLRYILKCKEINTVVCGMSSFRHLEENVNFINLILNKK